MPISTITPQELQGLIASGTVVDLIDVRTSVEFARAHATLARNVPLTQLNPTAVIANRLAAKTDPIYFICASGSRSASAAEAFVTSGFERATHVVGGTNAWIAAGLPTISAPTEGLVSKSTILALTAVAAMWLIISSFWGMSAHAKPQVGAISSTPTAAHATPAPMIDFKKDVVEASNSKAVLVDYFATWCEPCSQLSPELEAVAEQNSATVSLVRVDIERQEELAIAQKIEPIPDVRLWKGGQEIAHFIGYKSRAQVSEWLTEALKGAAANH